MSKLHKVFVSYHHENDESYKKIFELRFGKKYGSIIPNSVQIGDINPNAKPETIRRTIRDCYLRNPSVTVVLIGIQTWQRKYVDWEISSSLRNTELNPRAGLLGLLLPSHPDFRKGKYRPEVVPPRLHDNLVCGYAVLADWTNDPQVIQDLVHNAYLRRGRVEPDNSRPLFVRNRSSE